MSAFAEWQPHYAARDIPTFPVSDKRPCVRAWQKVGLGGSSQLALKFPEADAFAFQCGKRSRITLLDIDSSQEWMVEEAIRRFGRSPVIWRTGGNNYAMPFRYNGERRRIRVLQRDGLPIDILGQGGYAVAPPSLGSKRRYEFLEGSLDDFEQLPTLRLPVDGDSRNENRIPIGKRSNTLFNLALEQAPYVDDLDDLIDVVRTRNMHCEEPLSDAEVVKTGTSAWGYQLRGENLKGRGGAVVIPNSVIDALIDDADAWCLYGKLRRHHWRHDFALAKSMAASMRWTLPRWKRARNKLVEVGEIKCIHRGGGGPGDPPIYRLRDTILYPNKKLDTPLLWDRTRNKGQ